jgi:hypothetical protein
MRSTFDSVAGLLVRTAHDQPRVMIGSSGISMILLLELIMLLFGQRG